MTERESAGIADTGDTGDFPQGPFPDGGGEADSPQHCGKCGEFLKNALTDYGVWALKGAIEETGPEAVTPVMEEWRRFYL